MFDFLASALKQDLPKVQDRGCGVLPISTEICGDWNGKNDLLAVQSSQANVFSETLLRLLWLRSYILMIRYPDARISEIGVFTWFGLGRWGGPAYSGVQEKGYTETPVSEEERRRHRGME